MTSNIVKNIFWVLFNMFLVLCNIVGLTIASVELATSGELLLIAYIVVCIICVSVFMTFSVMSIREIIDDCSETDKMLKEVQDAEDKS
nr:MAG TPA: hypothetical protein [Caudoviricetes sp.]